MSALLLGLAGVALGVGIGLWVGRARAPEAPPDPLDTLDAEALWARSGEVWTRLERDGEGWVVGEQTQGAPVRFPRSTGWAESVLEQPEVVEALDGWTTACADASAVPWSVGLPTGAALIDRWATEAPPSERPARDFARWLVGALGRSGRSGLRQRADAEQRGVAITRVHRAASALILALDPGLSLELAPRGGVGPRDAERWLVDEELARTLGNAPVGGVVQPVVVLRPRLLDGEGTVLEGEVA